VKHYNVQIQIQRVEEPEPGKRRVTELLKLAVAAGTEAEAYAKAHRMLTANEASA
jgi:hypothetical protein